MSKLSWYRHRLRAMSPAEMTLHARKKLRQFTDAREHRDWGTVEFECSGVFPTLPDPRDAPEMLREALKRDVENIMAGRWKAFGHLEIQVDDPPKWHCDYLAGRDLATNESAFKLDHRALPGGADIKLIWELSRWYQLVRLAMAAHVLGDTRAGEKCVAWLEHWVKHNPPYRGWNWTSALEAGMRLIQFTWIDALLSRAIIGLAPAMPERLAALRSAILPAHARFVWRHKSFGSSANNHLLGELAGLIVATARWPALAKWGASLDDLQGRWQREVFAQFAGDGDGGNREQALNYHLFSWEFCWAAMKALQASGRTVAPTILGAAVEFFCWVQVEKDAWDYGDSDNGFVMPFFAREGTATAEWWNWMHGWDGGAAIRYWCGEPTVWPLHTKGMAERRGGYFFRKSGIYVSRLNLWTLRWDLSPLGYLATAAHGHLDALHLSLWFKGVAIVVDPGTGAYYGDKALREWLASRTAHNGPCPNSLVSPKRLGPFLWSEHHAVPVLAKAATAMNELELSAHVDLGGFRIKRLLRRREDESELQVEDVCIARTGADATFTVRWQFAPGSWVKRLSPRKFSIHRTEVAVEIEVDENWAEVELFEPVIRDGESVSTPAPGESMEGIVSPAFRQTCRAPFLKLTARPGNQPQAFRTIFRVGEG